MDFAVFVVEKAKEHLHDLAFTVVVEFDAVSLQFAHQIVRRHETEVLVGGLHLRDEDTYKGAPLSEMNKRKPFRAKMKRGSET